MNNYNSTIILHAIDKSTLFLDKFKDEFSGVYKPFNMNEDSIKGIKTLLGDLEPKSLIVFLGHGSSSGLFEPDDTHTYEKYFLNVTLGNLYFDEHDIFLLSCKSNEYIQKIYKSNYSVGFGNIISSKTELDLHNQKSELEKGLSEEEIKTFNEIYVNSCIKVIKNIINGDILFQDTPKYIAYYINKEINKILLNKDNNNRIELAKLLFEFRNQIQLKYNLRT
ncbi:hypothetical protein [uncultured Tenacibaculum sp.]|uniref:hypothetical protein n=1 Tax=uncultured Tenacibaculum sp. TaxID=174713 RepID=UPI0026305785|nr:hypothetical protein [uncultured Tenacibaculum sp.]